MKEFLHKYGFSSLNELLTIGNHNSYRENLALLLAFYSLKTIRDELSEDDRDVLILKLKLHWPLQEVLKRTGRGEHSITRDVSLLMLLLKDNGNLFEFSKIQQYEKLSGLQKAQYQELMAQKTSRALQMLDNEYIRNFIGVNEYKNVLYFSKESYQELIDWFFSISVLGYFTFSDTEITRRETEQIQAYIKETVRFLISARDMSSKAGYQLELLKSEIQNPPFAEG